MVEITILRALAHQAAGEHDQALAELSRALADAVPAGYVRVFLDEGRADGAAAAGGRGSPRVRRARPRPARRDRRRQRPARGLSARELEVLRLLATGLSGPEISQQLFVSLNTLRTHTKHIFSKLDVNTRQAAVRRATELGLL